jgi:hypothetical protein
MTTGHIWALEFCVCQTYASLSAERFDSRAALTIFPLVIRPTLKNKKNQSAEVTDVIITKIRLAGD